MSLDLPTPETVLMEAMFDDSQADKVLEDLEVPQMIKWYTGGKVILRVENIKKYGKTTIPTDNQINLANRKLHTLGWHLEMRKDKNRKITVNPGDHIYYHGYDLVLSKYRYGLIQRVIRAFNVLIGRE